MTYVYPRRSSLVARRRRPSPPPLFARSALGDVAAQSLPCPSGSGLCPPFIASVEAWRDDVAAQAGTKPVDFLLAWIQRESAGNPCSWTSLREAGIFQLMDGDNMVQGNTSVALQHPVPPCATNAQTNVGRASLTDAQAYEQVRGGLQYVDYCQKRAEAFLGQYGYLNQPGWTDADWSYWCFVKMYHALPGAIPGLLANGLQGGGIPADWDAMMQYSSQTSATINAKAVGIFGEGGGSVLGAITGNTTLFVVALGGLAVAAWLLTRRV